MERGGVATELLRALGCWMVSPLLQGVQLTTITACVVRHAVCAVVTPLLLDEVGQLATHAQHLRRSLAARAAPGDSTGGLQYVLVGPDCVTGALRFEPQECATRPCRSRARAACFWVGDLRPAARASTWRVEPRTPVHALTSACSTRG